MQWNPWQVGLGTGVGRSPWTPGGQGGSTQNPSQSGGQIGQSTPNTSGYLAPSAVRATGTGPYDSAYRQNLATYAGGQLYNPTGYMGFNPTQPSSYPGQPTGGGTAPLPGMPNTLLQQSTLGQPFSWVPPTPSGPSTVSGPEWSGGQWPTNFQNQWLQNFMSGANGYQAYAPASGSIA